MAMRWAVVIVNDQVKGTDGLTVMSRSLRSGRGIPAIVEHGRERAYEMGVLLRLPEAYIALLLGADIAREIVVGLVGFHGEREAPGVDRFWRALERRELTAVSARLQRMAEREGIVHGATIAEVSFVRTGACPTCKIVAFGEGWEGYHASAVQGLKTWAAWRAKHIREVA